tara:strand:- start:11008 stop:11319 length:312 start_codon:yes stop_codon:yes gene_type:complete
MLIVEVLGTPQIFGKYKQSIKRRFRCQSGPRKGRIVADPSTCTKPINIRKRQQFKATRQKLNTIQSKRATYTKKYNPTSKIVKKLNTQVKSKRRAKPLKVRKK